MSGTGVHKESLHMHVNKYGKTVEIEDTQQQKSLGSSPSETKQRAIRA